MPYNGGKGNLEIFHFFIFKKLVERDPTTKM